MSKFFTPFPPTKEVDNWHSHNIAHNEREPNEKLLNVIELLFRLGVLHVSLVSANADEKCLSLQHCCACCFASIELAERHKKAFMI